MRRLMGDEVTVKHIDCPFADDVVVTKVDSYYKLTAEEELTIDVDVDTSTGQDFTFGIDSDDPGRYAVILTGKSDLNALAQIPMTVYCSSIPFGVITWNGLEGQTGTQESEFIMLSRYNVFRLHFGAPGVKLISIKVKLKVRAEDDPFFKGE